MTYAEKIREALEKIPGDHEAAKVGDKYFGNDRYSMCIQWFFQSISGVAVHVYRAAFGYDYDDSHKDITAIQKALNHDFSLPSLMGGAQFGAFVNWLLDQEAAEPTYNEDGEGENAWYWSNAIGEKFNEFAAEHWMKPPKEATT